MQLVPAVVFVQHAVFDTIVDVEEFYGAVLQNIHVCVHARVFFSSAGEHDRVYSNRRVRVGVETGFHQFRIARVFVYDFVRDGPRVLSERDVVPFGNRRVYE